MRRGWAGGLESVLRFAVWLMLLGCMAPSRSWADGPQFEFQAPASVADPKMPAIMRDLAERLLPVYQEPDPDRYLANLSLLQMAAGNFSAAKASRESLRDRRRSADAGRPVGRAVIYDLYVAARALEAEGGVSFADAFRKSFRDLVPRLSDPDAYAVTAWLQIPPLVARNALQAALDQLRARDSLGEAEAAELIRSYLGFDAYRSFAPLVGSLSAEDDRRRYASVSEVLVDRPHRETLALTIVRPKNASKPLPALLEYTLQGTPNHAKESAAHGYVGVVAYARPKVGRKGKRVPGFVPYEHDGDAARVVLDWIAKQPWSDGRVGMFGDGYSGFAAWAAAKRPSSALKAIATSAAMAPGISAPMQGGIFHNSAYRWSLQVTGTEAPAGPGDADEAPWRALDQKWYASGRRYRDLGRLFGKHSPSFIRWLNHPSYDGYWQKMIPYRDEFAHLAIPVLSITGYYAGNEPGDLYYLREHDRHDPHADHTLLIGPYDDGVMQFGAPAALHGLQIDPAALVDLHELRFQWFDHVLKGAPAPALLKDRVNYEVMGANQWRHAASLDAMATGSIRFYLSAATSGDNRLVQTKASRPTFIEQTVSLSDRSDADWTAAAGLTAKSLLPHNALVFVSDALKKPVEFDGLLSGRFDLWVNKMDVDLSLMLYERLANGDYVSLFSPAYEFRASYAKDPVHRRLLKAGERQELTFESERLMSRQLQAGSRLVLVLGVAKQPNREINYGTGNDVSVESIADGRVPIRLRWYGDSYMDLPVRR